jgi:hypothetical protein
MDAELIARIGAEHRCRLAWLEEHKGEVSAIPGPLDDGLLLAAVPPLIPAPRAACEIPFRRSSRCSLHDLGRLRRALT